MSRTTVAMLPEDILNTRVGEAPSRDEALTQSLSRAPSEMMLASRPRTFDLVSEPVRAGLEIGHDYGEQSHYLFSIPSARIAPNRIASQAFPTNTAVHLSPIAMRNPLETQGQEEAVQYEITQNGLKFKGNVRGIKIIATQVASKTGQDTSEYHLSGDEEQSHQSQGQGKQDNGFINQNGARFLQSVTDTDFEENQSVGGKEFYVSTQDAAEVEGDVIGGSFINNQRVW